MASRVPCPQLVVLPPSASFMIQFGEIQCHFITVQFLLQKGEADAVTLDGGLVYTAGVCGLVPVMSERYDGECSPEGDRADAKALLLF